VTAKRPRRPPTASETARKEILDGAARLFMTHGYHATSVRTIGEELDIGQSSPYYHARNKSQILVDLNDEFMTRLVADFDAIANTDQPAISKLSAAIQELLRTMAEHQDIVAVVLQERRSLPPDAAEAVQRQRDHIDALLDGFITDGIAQGSFRELNVPLVRLALTGMTNWAVTWFRPNGDLGADEIADGFIDLLLRGMAA